MKGLGRYARAWKSLTVVFCQTGRNSYVVGSLLLLLLAISFSCLNIAHIQTNHQCKPLANEEEEKDALKKRRGDHNAKERGEIFSSSRSIRRRRKKVSYFCRWSLSLFVCLFFSAHSLILSRFLRAFVTYALSLSLFHNDLIFFFFRKDFYFRNLYDFHWHNLTIDWYSPLILLL